MPAERPHDRAAEAWALRVVLTVKMEDAGAPRVLDLGCGDGRLAGRLAAEGASVVGVDPSRTALERARSRLPGIEFLAPAGDGGLPLADAAFDVVTCVHVLQHVPDTQRLLSEARRVLKPRGRLALSVPWHGRLKDAALALVSFERRHDPLEPELRFYTPRSLRSLLPAFGFDDVTLRGAGGVPLARRTLLAAATRS